MKTITIIAVTIIMFAIVAAGTPSNEPSSETNNEARIEFNSASWNEILSIAKKENKSIFIDISTSWCRYCKKMKANVFTDTEVANYYNSNFINVSVDAEKGEGTALARKYGTRGYPTFVFINSDGSLVKQTSGYRKAEKFLELGKSISNN